MISVGGPWYDEARIIRSAGYLSGETYPYQEFVLAGMHQFEEVDEVEKYNQFVESLYAIVQPEAYKKYKKKTDLQREEEGVDEVVYHGEDDWKTIMSDFKAFGIENVDVFGEGLNLSGT